MQQAFSFKSEMWKRLKKNGGAMFGLIIIILSLLVSVFGYVIAPDNSPNADLQTVEIQAKKPGYAQEFLKIPGNNITKNRNQNRQHNDDQTKNSTSVFFESLPHFGFKRKGLMH